MILVNEEKNKKFNIEEYDMEDMDYFSVKEITERIMINKFYIHRIEIFLKKTTLHWHIKIKCYSEKFIEEYIK